MGVCRVIKPTGPLDGLLGGRFLTAFAACLFTGAAKGALIGFLVAIPVNSMSYIEKIGLFFVISLPPLFMAIFSTIAFTRNSFKIIIFKPELIIMPIGTYYIYIHTYNYIYFSVTFFSFSKMKHNPCHQDCRVAFSPLFTIINIIISTICYSLLVLVILKFPQSVLGDLLVVAIFCVVPHFLGIVFTLIFIFYDKICCYCGQCCLGAEERMVYDPSQPEKQLLWTDGKVPIKKIEKIYLSFFKIIELEKSQEEMEEETDV